MPKYRVHAHFDRSAWTTVEAENEDAAMDEVNMHFLDYDWDEYELMRMDVVHAEEVEEDDE